MIIPHFVIHRALPNKHNLNIYALCAGSANVKQTEDIVFSSCVVVHAVCLCLFVCLSSYGILRASLLWFYCFIYIYIHVYIYIYIFMSDDLALHVFIEIQIPFIID